LGIMRAIGGNDDQLPIRRSVFQCCESHNFPILM
jgi:hypothetical protein